MPIIELITPGENRIFNASLRNWLGDAQWIDGPVGTQQGVAQLTPQFHGDTKTMTLEYPYVKVRPLTTPNLTFIITVRDFSFGVMCKWRLTDGTTLFSGQQFIQGVDVWTQVVGPITADASWNEDQTRLEIDAYAINIGPTRMCCDNFSLLYDDGQQYKQHLPILGVG